MCNMILLFQLSGHINRHFAFYIITQQWQITLDLGKYTIPILFVTLYTSPIVFTIYFLFLMTTSPESVYPIVHLIF